MGKNHKNKSAKTPKRDNTTFGKDAISENDAKKNQSLYVILFLVISTTITYHGVFTNDFINFDDGVYITNNIHVKQGLTWEGIRWAFTSLSESNWHPLSWLSHMLDVEMFGLNPVGHHFSNLILHVIATLLLFGFLRYATAKLYLSMLVASLFALHPVHVESVAWAAERKDVLSALFFFATLWAYVYYTRRPEVKRYVLVLILFALGLLSKPMLVSLPFILLLLDYWPLERISLNKNSKGKLIIEKLPFFLMAFGSSLITIIAQHSAISGFNRINLSVRILNTLSSYCVYLGQAFWPSKLAIFYPYTLHPIVVNVVFCAIVLIGIFFLVGLLGRKNKFLLTGWFWYLVTLIPVIGIVQVGEQAHADRYTYIPFVGIFLMVVWGINSIIDKIHRKNKIPVAIILTGILSAMVFKTIEQVGYWKNSITLFSYAATVTKNNSRAYMNLGLAFEKTGQIQNALESYQKAVDAEPQYADSHYNLATILANLSRLDEAIYHFKKVCEIDPNNAKNLNNLGVAYMQTYQISEATPVFQKALSLAKAAGNDSLAQLIAGNFELIIKERDSLQAVTKPNVK